MWGDLRDTESRLRQEWDGDLRRVEHKIDANHAEVMGEMRHLRGKVEEHDSFIDRLRGMSTVIVFLIGSNLALVILTALGLLLAFNGQNSTPPVP